jgi:hypothetical protein
MVGGSGRGASTVLGVLLLVGVVVVVGGVVAIGALTFLDGIGAPQATATFDYERTPVGLRMIPSAISTPVTVQLNGQDVATFEPDSAGQSVLLPTAPGDRITVVSRDGDKSVLVDRSVDDRSEVGDFIAYYTFDGESGDTTLEDRSGTENDGQPNGDLQWRGDSLRFDGSGDYVEVNDIQAPDGVEVSEFTVAIAFNERNRNGIAKLFEHNYGPDDDEWYMELKGTSPRALEFTITDFTETVRVEGIPQDERHVAVGVYDGSEYTLYVNGRQSGTISENQDVNLGEMNIAAETDGGLDKEFDGNMYEMRLYHHAFDEDEVEVITEAME